MHPFGMQYQRVSPDDETAVALVTDMFNAVNAVDDPDEPPALPGLVAGDLKYGWELEPGERYLYYPDGASEPVGSIRLHAPKHDNLHMVSVGMMVHPDHRRKGHGNAMATELLRRAKQMGRFTVWAGCAHDDPAAEALLKSHGFTYASHDVRRFQYPAELDHDQLDKLYADARARAADYELVRTMVPTDDDVLAQLVEVTAAINDAPMGELDFEDEKFDLQRLRDFETAAQKKGETMYRVYARHKQTGAIGGHTVMMVQPLQPTYGWQYDTAVHRDHRGHRLGTLVKLEMMRWLAEAEPQIERIETWNNADNSYMINANEAIGYRLSRVFDTYQRVLDHDE
jgi:RimJ/RimL family protein N-acetyltransferase